SLRNSSHLGSLKIESSPYNPNTSMCMPAPDTALARKYMPFAILPTKAKRSGTRTARSTTCLASSRHIALASRIDRIFARVNHGCSHGDASKLCQASRGGPSGQIGLLIALLSLIFSNRKLAQLRKAALGSGAKTRRNADASHRAIDAATGSQSTSTTARLPPDLGERQASLRMCSTALSTRPLRNRKWIADFTYVWTAEGPLRKFRTKLPGTCVIKDEPLWNSPGQTRDWLFCLSSSRLEMLFGAPRLLNM